MATTINSSALDFNAIKNNLKTYLKQQSEFSDYDFEASALSNVLDVLAYNTHMNGLTANMALNESFLNTAQLRSSVVSHAETLGYVPQSRTGAMATLNLSFNIGIDQPDVPEKLQITSGYKFTASVDDTTYTFQTQELIEALNDGNNFFQFKTLDGNTNIPVYEGVAKTKTFFAGEDGETTIYIIPDRNMDRKTAVVKIYESAVSSDFTTYVNLETATNITATTPAYILKEAPNGYFELTFGNGSTLGAVPRAGSKITVEYLSVAGKDANGALTFEPVNEIEVTEPSSGVGLRRLPITSTSARSAGGAEKESLDSIRRNAPYRYATQNRMVTHVDYANLILREYGTYIKDIIAWGGEDNLSPEFGTTFLSIVFNDDIQPSLQSIIKDNIRVLVGQLSIASFDLKFSDPVTTFIESTLFFQFNPDYTNLSINALQDRVKTKMTDYFNRSTGKFGQAFRRSNLLSEVDEVSRAILSSRVEIKMQQRFTPSANVEQNFSFDFPVPISVPDDVNYIVESSTFKYDGKNCKIRNQLIQPTTTTTLTVSQSGRLPVVEQTNALGQVTSVVGVAVGGSSSTTASAASQVSLTKGLKLQVIDTATGNVLISNIGEYIPSSGIIRLVGFLSDETKSIKISATPANPSAIVPEREYILNYDNTRLTARGLRTTANN